jgi:alginate O-acetyltransferase complex protein AlgI
MFYAAWDWRFLGLILASTLIDYFVGLGLSRELRRKFRTALLLASLAGNLGILGFFKYWNFFAQSGGELFEWLGIPYHPWVLSSLVLPVGISFYTFQTLSYSIDVYRKKIKATRSLLDLALFVGFFPQLVAGPIVRASEFLPQLGRSQVFSQVASRRWLLLFLVGFFKKACIADNLAPIVDRYFAQPEAYTALAAWTAVLFFAVQIYCDFSGYSDMAIACAGLLGYRLGENFHAPYLASNISAFWRRWHISLSSWLRDYLYIPMGGNRGSRLTTYRNIMLTMIIGGLWHGARWNFVIWGALHAVALIAHKEWQRRRPAFGAHRTWLAIAGAVATFWWVCVTWIFFRTAGEFPEPFTQDVSNAWTVFKAFVFFDSSGAREVPGSLWWFVVLSVVHVLAYVRQRLEILERMPDWAFAILYGFAFSAVIAFLPARYTPFIYFQF